MTETTTEPRCAYDVILSGLDNEAPCVLAAGHEGPHVVASDSTAPPTGAELRTDLDAIGAAALSLFADATSGAPWDTAGQNVRDEYRRLARLALGAVDDLREEQAGERDV